MMTGFGVLLVVLVVMVVGGDWRMEAVFKDLVPTKDGTGIDHLKLDYSDETKKHMQEILEKRVNQLTAVYCKGVTEPMIIFAREHGPQFNLTAGEADIYDVCIKILEVLSSLPGAFAPALETCKKANTTTVGQTEKKQALLTLLCVNRAIEKERAALNDIEISWRWSVDAKTDAALADLDTAFACPQLMTRLGLYQLDVEYKRDGVVKANAAGRIPEARMREILARNPVPTRGDYLRYLARVKIEVAKEKAAATTAAAPDSKEL